jgi:hypothetical protein
MAARQYRSTVEAKTLSASINNSIGSMTVNTASTLPNSFPYTLVIDPDTATEEIVTVTASSGGGTTLAITRGQDGTSAQAHDSGAVVKHMITARDLQEPQDHIAATSAIHGVTGSVVGTSDTQTLTNKTVNLTNNTLTGTTAQFNTALSDGNFATQAGTETLTNKTLTSPKINEDVAVTATATELNILDGVTASAAELNILDGVTTSTAELNYVDGVTSAIQTQLDSKAPTSTTVTLTGSQTLTNKTLTTPSISSPLISGDIDSPGIIGATTNAGAGRGLLVKQPSGNGSDAIIQFTNNAASSQLAALNASGAGAFTVTSTTAYWPAVRLNTVSATANVVVSSDYQLRLATSSVRYKKDIEDLDPATADSVLNLRPVWFRSKESSVDDAEQWSHVGLIAEEVAEVQPRLVFFNTVEPTLDEHGNLVFDENGQQQFTTLDTPTAEGVNYDKLAVYLLDIIKREKTRSNDLEQRLIALEAKVAELEAK